MDFSTHISVGDVQNRDKNEKKLPAVLFSASSFPKELLQLVMMLCVGAEDAQLRVMTFCIGTAAAPSLLLSSLLLLNSLFMKVLGRGMQGDDGLVLLHICCCSSSLLVVVVFLVFFLSDDNLRISVARARKLC